MLHVGNSENLAAETKLIEKAIQQGFDQVHADCVPSSLSLVWTNTPQTRFDSSELVANLPIQQPNDNLACKLSSLRSHPDTKIAVVPIGSSDPGHYLYAVIDFSRPPSDMDNR